MRLKLSRFNPDNIRPHRVILVIGKRGTGKSHLIRDLLQHMSDRFDFGLAFAPTEASYDLYNEHMPSSCLYREFSTSKVESMINLQRSMTRTGNPKSLFMLMDDCAFDKKVMKGPEMRQVMMNGRHLYVTYICGLQYCLDWTPDLRSNVDYVICLRENIQNNKKKLYEYFFGVFSSFAEFNLVFDKCTQNYSAMVMDNTNPGSNRIEDTIFWYRAQPQPSDFKMCKPAYWKMTDRYERDEDEETFTCDPPNSKICDVETVLQL